MKIAKIILIYFVCIIFGLQKANADFIVNTNKQLDVNKDSEITARLEDENKIFKGYVQAEHTKDEKTQKALLKVSITWTNMFSKEGHIQLDGLNSIIYIDKPIIASGTALLIKGSLPYQVKTQKENNEDNNNNKRTPASSTNTGTTTNIASPVSSPVETPTNNDLFQPKVITTYDGCNHVYDQNKETILAYQQSYYFDKNGKKVQTEACKPAKTFPAQKKACDNFNDFTNHYTYIRYQPYFSVKSDASGEAEPYSAGGCVQSHQYPHLIDFTECPATAVGSQYIKQGKWYYQTESGDKNFISGCILDPRGESKELLIEFDGCPVTHDVLHNQSTHLGRYYWIRPDNTKEYLGDCSLTKHSYFEHQLEWKEKWDHHNDNWYSQRLLTRFIYIDTESRKIIVDDEEKDPPHYSQTEKQHGWVNHDDYGAKGANGFSAKLMKRYVPFNNIDYYTNFSYEGSHVAHILLDHIMTRKEDCGGGIFSQKKRRFYRDTIKRPDGTQYTTNEYEGSCK